MYLFYVYGGILAHENTAMIKMQNICISAKAPPFPLAVTCPPPASPREPLICFLSL